jgi:integrase
LEAQTQAVIVCPSCGCTKVFANGHREAYGVDIQRFKCGSPRCGYRFSDPTALKTVKYNKTDSQQKHASGGTELLATLEKQGETSAGINNPQQGLIFEFEWKQKKRQLKPKTIHDRSMWLTQLADLGCDLKSPDSFETILATETIPTPTKANMVSTYVAFTKAFKIPWERIKIHYEAPIAFDPLEEEVDLLIAACGKRTATFLQTLKDTGARVGELKQLEWTDINEKNNTIAIQHPEKGSRARVVKVSEKTIAVLKLLPKKYGSYVFSPNSVSATTAFEKARKRMAERMNNPRLLKIHFHTLRHFRGSREYEKTGDIYHVKDVLGHKSITNTDKYQHSLYTSDEYVTKRPKTSQEEDALISSGFEFVRFDDREQAPIYRKRK